MNNRKLLVLLGLFLTAAVLVLVGLEKFRGPPTALPPPEQYPPDVESPIIEKEMILTNLDIPWEIAFLPSGEMLITERSGRLLIINQDRETIQVDGVRHVGEGGLLGLAVHFDYEDNNWIYLYLTSEVDGGITNRVERYQLIDNQLTNRTVIIDGIPGGTIHNGGRIKFGPDRYLYITIGDAGLENSAQDRDSLSGKILRLNADGSIPEDNPFGTAIWSWGHRNPQGLAWDDQGRLWATEHGPTAQDELNLIEPGRNYGWPVIRGSEQREGMAGPVIQSGADTTWAPAGAEYYQGSIYFAGLRGSTLYEYRIEEGKLVEHLAREYGRLRAVTLKDGFLYISTSNTDGRGNPIPEDDRIIKINPDEL